MEQSLAHKRALVTGAGKGIGRATAKALLECGAEVIALSRTQSDLDSLVQESPKMLTICVDISDWEATENSLKDIGRIDLLVNNAAVAILQPFLSVTEDAFDKLFDVNVKALLHVSQIIAKGMMCRGEGGSIVNISSQASKCALRDHAVYSSALHTRQHPGEPPLHPLPSIHILLVNVMKCCVISQHVSEYKIRVNAINPTVVMTAMGRIGWSDPAKAAGMLSRIPLHRFAEVEDVVNTIIFLLSDKSAMINGVTLPVDGGFLSS
ncbi:L-xylulose reductase isoform X1 [Stegostoma tigrinum]|uniref:L-xylulose reductase isoform X1 n=1 Tax=Stegostoma tigrinum TaxID=3053191 RepID=UPI0028706D73|nr:L-xylulose reductase isoform X1 [Stegostoma tigrinum]